MPNGRLNIGVGEGGATVWNPQQAVQSFNNIIQTRQAKQAAEQAELAKELASVKMDGLRNDADRQSFVQQYQQLKDQGKMSLQERDPLKRAMAKANIKQGLLNLQDYVGRSKQAGQRDNEILRTLSDPNKRHNYNDDGVQQAIANTKLALNDPNFKPDYTFLSRRVDDAKENEKFSKANKLGLSQSQWSNPIESTDKQGNKNGVVIYNQRQLTPEQLLANHAHMYDTDDDIKQSLEQRYPDVKGANANETKMLRIRQNALDRGDLVQDTNGALQTAIVEKSRPTFRPDREPDRFYEHYAFSHKDDNTRAEQPVDQSIPYNNGKSNVQIKGYVPLSIPNKNFAGNVAYNLTTGQRDQPLESSDSYSVVGVGNTPFIKAGYLKNPKLEGSVAQPDWVKANPNGVELRPMVHVKKKLPTDEGGGTEDYLIDYNKLPQNVKNSKPVRQALGNFRPAGSNQQVSTAKTSTDTGYGQVTDAQDAKGNVIQIGVKNGKWYDIKTHKPVE